jgi:DNA-binding NarL/FixJ family response regulator
MRPAHLNFIACGFTNPEIAARLGLSVKTMRNQVSLIFAKLKMKRRTEAIVRARQAGL